MEKINVDDAVGMVLCHDMTEIKDNKKTVPFRKGHILKAEDIEHLKSMGKFHIYVWDTEKGYIHENDGAEIMLNSAVPDMSRGYFNPDVLMRLLKSCDGPVAIVLHHPPVEQDGWIL